MTTGTPFPIVRHAAPELRTPVLVSVPHYGTQPLPHITRADYGEPHFETFAYGFADTFASDLYADLHEHGATVLATPFSRMFVDVNRRRDDFEHLDGEVRSRRGVVRTHTMRDVSIFARPLGLADLEARLQALYDPYYATLDQLLGAIHQRYGYALLLDGHTGSPRRMKDHQVIIGTRHDATCALPLVETVATIFTRHGFEVHRNISGYTGGNIVATYGQPADPACPRASAGDQRVTADDDQPRGVHRPHHARWHPGQGRGEHRPRPPVPARGPGRLAGLARRRASGLRGRSGGREKIGDGDNGGGRGQRGDGRTASQTFPRAILPAEAR